MFSINQKYRLKVLIVSLKLKIIVMLKWLNEPVKRSYLHEVNNERHQQQEKDWREEDDNCLMEGHHVPLEVSKLLCTLDTDSSDEMIDSKIQNCHWNDEDQDDQEVVDNMNVIFILIFIWDDGLILLNHSAANLKKLHLFLCLQTLAEIFAEING